MPVERTAEQERAAIVAAAGVTIPWELFNFLMGVGEIDGTSFGDMNDSLPGRFWWRALLKTAANAPLSPSTSGETNNG